jgi:uncharacterized membrane protein YedE/YeeE
MLCPEPEDIRLNRRVLIAAALALAALFAAAWSAAGATLGWAALIGALAGVGLYHASFGFTAAWRRFVRERRGAGLRAQMVLIGLTCVFSFPLMAWGADIGLPARGVILPMGVASAFGAFIFGIGMQLGGGCASGTLFTVGGGSSRMVVVLAFFIAGSVWVTAHWDFWTTLPRTRSGVSLLREFGPLPALALMLAFLGAIWAGSRWLEMRAHGTLEPLAPTESLLRGRWSLMAGAVTLAIVGVLCFLVLGRPWGVTAGFALWGAKILDGVGVPVTDWSYWSGWRKGTVEASVFANGTSVMNFGIVIGAMAAAAAAGRFAPNLNLSRRDLATAVIGGLLMGYGARLAYGCNIGAYLGGLVSGSLHGVWWLIWGFAGSMFGTWARQRLAMDPPLPPRAAAI